MTIECCQCHEEIPADEQDLLVCEECWSTAADTATTDIKNKLETARQKIVKLEKFLDVLMSQYGDLLEKSGGNPDPSIQQTAKEVLGYY